MSGRLVVIVPPDAIVLKADNDRAPIHQRRHQALNSLDADRIVTVYDDDVTQERPRAKPYTIRYDADAGGWLYPARRREQGLRALRRRRRGSESRGPESKARPSETAGRFGAGSIPAPSLVPSAVHMNEPERKQR